MLASPKRSGAVRIDRAIIEQLEPRKLLAAADLFEVDDTWSGAKVLPLTGVTQARSLHTATDVDWGKFTLTQSSKVTIQTNGVSGDTEMALFSAVNSTTRLYYDDDSGTGSFSQIVAYLDPGTYYVGVDEYGQNATIDAYTLSATSTPLSPDAFEVDDTSAAAKALVTNGTAQSHSIHRPTDIDWVKFTLSEGSRVTLQTGGTSGSPLTSIYSATNLSSTIASASGFVSQVLYLDAGTYYVRVQQSSQSDVINAYTIAATAVPYRTYRDAFEADDSWATAKVLPLTGSVQNHNLHRPTDVDWAKFTLTQAMQVTLTTSGTTGDTEMALYSAANSTTRLFYDDDSGTGSFSQIVAFLNPGTYYVGVDEYGQNSTIDAYTLSATTTAFAPDAFESDNTPATAKVLPTTGTVQNRSIHQPTDLDWAKVTLTEASRVTFDSSAAAGQGELSLYTAANTSTTIARSTSGGTNGFPKLTVDLDAGTYYLKFNEYGTDATIGAYTLKASAIPMRLIWDAYEVDNTAPAAKPIVPNAADQVHSIHAPGDVDWVKFTLTTAADVVISTDGTAGDTYLSLYSSANTTTPLVTDDDAGNASFSRIVKMLPSGTYLVAARAFSSSAVIDRYLLGVKTFALADLSVTAGTFSPAGSVTLGGNLAVNWTVRNVGAGSADPGHNNTASWIDGIYLSTDSTWSSTDLSLTTLTRTGSLASSASYNASGTVTLPLDNAWAGRSAYLLIKSDTGAVVADAGVANNVRVVPITINPYVDLTSPGPGRFADPKTTLAIKAAAFDRGGTSVIDIALDTDSNPNNGSLKWLAQNVAVTNATAPLAINAALAGVAARSTPYYLWARIRRPAGGPNVFSKVQPITIANAAAMSDDALGDQIGNSTYEVFGIDAARIDRSLYVTARTNFKADDVGRGGDLRFVVNGVAYGLAVNTHTLAGGGQVTKGTLYANATFLGGTTVSTVPTFINSYGSAVTGRSAVNVVATPDRPWDYEIQARVDLAAFSNYSPGSTVTSSWAMYCGNDTDDVAVTPEAKPDLRPTSFEFDPANIPNNEPIPKNGPLAINNSFTVIANIQNNSTSACPATRVNFVLSENSTIGDGDDWIFASTSLAAIAPNATATVNLVVNGLGVVPRRFGGAGRLMGVIADSTAWVTEESETNNTKGVPVQLFDPITPRTNGPLFATRALAEQYLTSAGFSPPDLFDSQWSREYSGADRFSWFFGEEMPAEFFRTDAAIRPPTSSQPMFQVLLQGPEPSPRFAIDPVNIALWGTSMTLYVRDYHRYH